MVSPPGEVEEAKKTEYIDLFFPESVIDGYSRNCGCGYQEGHVLDCLLFLGSFSYDNENQEQI